MRLGTILHHPVSRFRARLARIISVFSTDVDRPSLNKLSHGPFRRTQLATLFGTLPLFVFCHVLVAATLAPVIASNTHLSMAKWWLAFSYLPAVLLVALWVMHDRSTWLRQDSHLQSRAIDGCAVLFGLVWALCPVLFLPFADGALQLVLLIVTLVASGVGTLAFSRIPSAALLYCGIITASLAFSALFLGTEFGVPLCGFMICYGCVLASMVLNLYQDQQRQILKAQDIQRDKNIISLLLNDLESGTSDWLWECDSASRLTYVSPRLLEVLGKSRSEIAHHSLDELATTDRLAFGWEDMREKMARGEAFMGLNVAVNIHNTPEYWQLTASPLFDSEQRLIGYRGVGRDITTEWRTEQELIAAKEAAEAASSAKSHFLAVMSHELRTPLNAIVGFAEVLCANPDNAGNARLTRDYARTILDSSRHLQTLINDILDATRIENGSIALLEQESDAAELIEIAVRMCRDQAEKADVTLVARLLDDIEINVDMTRIKQIILNLLTNAIKFSPTGGIVNIEVMRLPNDDFEIVVRDAGIGIRAEDCERVFEPFVQAEEGMARRFAGIGLGLSIARKIARLHGGNITLESTYGAGTTVRFSLPAARVRWPQAGRTQQRSAVAA